LEIKFYDILLLQGKTSWKVTGLQSKETISDFGRVLNDLKGINDWVTSRKQKKKRIGLSPLTLYLKAQSNNQIEIFFFQLISPICLKFPQKPKKLFFFKRNAFYR